MYNMVNDKITQSNPFDKEALNPFYLFHVNSLQLCTISIRELNCFKDIYGNSMSPAYGATCYLAHKSLVRHLKPFQSFQPFQQF